MSLEKLATEIMYLGALVNANTELCVFIRYSGHVNMLEVDIAESKENYNSMIFDHKADMNNEKGTEGLEIIKEELIQILTDHSVPYETLVFAGPEVAATKTVEVVTRGSELADRVETLEKEIAKLKVLVSERPAALGGM